jgi:prepilin signal peptidase PulO-like enzyme (type II secretory pathway)
MVYAYGIFICFIGSAMIILNERKSEENDNKNSFSLNFIFIGSIYLTINVTLFSLGLVGQKFLCKEKLSPEEQTFYFGFYSFPTEKANCS